MATGTEKLGRKWLPLGEPRVPKNPSTLILPDGLLEEIIQDCTRFLNNQEWYQKRGIPYRRGYLLYGAPGSGKSSLVDVLAGVLHLNICLLTLTQADLTDQTINVILNSAPGNAIILIEDIDATFLARSAATFSNRLTFSGLLNALDGVVAQDGRLLFMTTNHIDVLDEALLREGRMDRKIAFGHATPSQAQKIFAIFYELPVEHELCVNFGQQIIPERISMAKLQGHLVMHAKPEEALAAVKNLFQQDSSPK